jgi:hypothetical protein
MQFSALMNTLLLVVGTPEIDTNIWIQRKEDLEKTHPNC